MDVDWCLACGRKTPEDHPYCSDVCMTLDGHRLDPAPSHRAFDLPALPPLRHLPRRNHHARPHPRFPADTLALTPKARFRDDELHDPPSPAKWSGRDREGILVWARAVSPGLDDPFTPSDRDAASVSDAALAAFHFTRPPFPLTSQNLAPPSVTLVPHHVLLSHTSLHSLSHHDEPAVPSLSQDDTSLLTPATGSVLTPAPPDPAPRPDPKPLGRFINKILCAWIAPPFRTPRAVPEGHPRLPSPDDGPEDDACHYATGLHAIPTRPRAVKIAGSSLPSRPYAQALRTPEIHAA